MDSLIGVGVGLGLAAAAGFRIFIPLLALSIGAASGKLPLASGFEWVGATPALIAFGTAAVLEVLGYFIPYVDHLLDVVATPAAVGAGMLATAALATELPPLLKWSAVIIGGGGLAGLVQGATALLRLKSTALTGGAGNPAVATFELFGSVTMLILALVLPLLAVGLALFLVVAVFRKTGRLLFGRKTATPSP
ncbi:MAG TPA: DUF4126 domain-containing protein [Gemmatimonadales bacterium]|nr:DUF4126 domain-containing protein [Gemmatimonadales bacterium]